MKSYISNLWIIPVLLLLVTQGCSSSNKAAKSDYDMNAVETNNSSIPLADYLKRVPGVSVIGSGSNAQVNVRGALSKHGNTSPLFVVDGTRYGRDFSKVQGIPVTDIKSVKVLKGVEASSVYGMEGAAGVIEITTKNS